MGYVEAVEQLKEQRQLDGVNTVTVNALFLARLAGMLGNIDAVNGFFRFNGKRIGSVTDFYESLALPGVRIIEPFHFVSTGEVDLNNLGRIAKNYSRAEANKYQDESTAELIGVLHNLWDQKIRNTGFFRAEKIETVKKVLDAGLLAFPIAEKSYAGRYPNTPTWLHGPVLNTEKQRSDWESICAVFKDAEKAYVTKNLQESKRQLEAAEAWTGWTEIAYDAVKSVRDLPFTAGGLVIDGLGWKNTTLLAVAGVAVLGYFAWRAGFFKGVIK